MRAAGPPFFQTGADAGAAATSSPNPQHSKPLNHAHKHTRQVDEHRREARAGVVVHQAVKVLLRIDSGEEGAAAVRDLWSLAIGSERSPSGRRPSNSKNTNTTNYS